MTEYDDGDTPIDLEAVDLIAEYEPLSGPHEATPSRLGACRECGGHVVSIENWRAPRDANEAWEKWSSGCVRSDTANWSFCVVTAAAWIDGKRRDFERRKKKPKAAPWDGVERRRR